MGKSIEGRNMEDSNIMDMNIAGKNWHMGNYTEIDRAALNLLIMVPCSHTLVLHLIVYFF
jgi:hypothetical protein